MTVFAPIGWHLTLRMHRDHDRVIATTLAEIRIAAWLFLRLGRKADLLAFGVADTHMHAVVACDRARAGRFVHDLEVALRYRLRLPVPFAPARFTPIERQRHLHNALGYAFRQDDRHGLGRDPFREGTNLPDLLGARAFGAWTTAGLRALLPRIGRRDLLPHLPWAAALEQPTDPASLHLLREAAAAVALVPHLDGRRPLVVATRRAAVHLALRHLGPTRVARLLGISRATVHRLRAQRTDPALTRALELQLRMRYAAARAGMLSRPAHAPVDSSVCPRTP
jgi:hypothetical protein